MQVTTVDACPCCGQKDLDWPMLRDEKTVAAFRLLSQCKYGGYMDGWERQLSLAMAQCRCCGHIWHHTYPDQASLFDMYAHGRRLKGGSASMQPTAHMLSIMRGVLRYCEPSGGEATLFDYGSGAGRWSMAARKVGFRVTAYEPAASRQGRTDDIEVIGSLQAIRGRRFDVINLEQVLEHVPDPVDDLRALKPYCHKKTVLRISVPDVTRLGSRIWDGFPFDGRSMHVLSPYEHLHGFSRPSLLALLRAADLEPCLDWFLLLCLPRYVMERWAIALGWPFGRTTVLARFRQSSNLLAMATKSL